MEALGVAGQEEGDGPTELEEDEEGQAHRFDSVLCQEDWHVGEKGETKELLVAVEKQEVEKVEVGEEEEEKVALQVLREKVNLVRDGGKRKCQEKSGDRRWE